MPDEDFAGDGFFIYPAVLGSGFNHGIFAADVVGDYGHVEVSFC